MYDEEKVFNEDREKCTLKRYHLLDSITDPGLKKIDELYSDADALSEKNDVKTNRRRLVVALCGVLITILYIFYTELGTNWIISGFIVAVIIFLILIKKLFDSQKRHTKHLQYRVLAESLRAQFFIYYAGLNVKVSEYLPWTIRYDMPWIADILDREYGVEFGAEKSVDYNVVRDFCNTQIRYHKFNKKDDKEYNEMYTQMINISLIITIALYVFAFLFDCYIAFTGIDVNNIVIFGLNLIEISFYLKITMGFMSVITLLANGLFGKMSLENRICDHKRMYDLYTSVLGDIMDNKSNNEFVEENFLYLIREFLIENSSWYVYESQNKIKFLL